LDFRTCLKNWDTPKTLFFCDPPYYGLQYYRHNFSESDHTDLHDILEKISGKILLTYNDHPKIRELYADFHIAEAKQTRMAELVRDGGKRNRFVNLIITNYRLPTQKAIP